jgi:mannose-6-phosphate isomerase
MWYILNADEHALIRAGFNRQLSPDEFVTLLNEGSILDVVNSSTSRPGDVFYLQAGQIHCIGAGNFLVEIQQSSDITYRVWDYNRHDADGKLRPLHVEEAREALDFSPREDKVLDRPNLGPGMTGLVNCPYFLARHLEFDGDYTFENPGCQSFVAMVCIQGEATLQVEGMKPVTVQQGETILVPAIAERVEMSGAARLLLASIPTEEDKNL